MNKKEKHYDWEDYHTTVWELGKKLKKQPALANVKGLIPIARGGLVPATLLSHYLDIPVVECLRVKSYEGKTQVGVKLFEPILQLGYPEIKEYIFVDDILDSGNTVKAVRSAYPLARFAISIAKQSGLDAVGPDALCCKVPVVVPDDLWIVFPWEQQTLI